MHTLLFIPLVKCFIKLNFLLMFHVIFKFTFVFNCCNREFDAAHPAVKSRYYNNLLHRTEAKAKFGLQVPQSAGLREPK